MGHAPEPGAALRFPALADVKDMGEAGHARRKAEGGEGIHPAWILVSTGMQGVLKSLWLRTYEYELL